MQTDGRAVNPVELIVKKRNGETLTESEIRGMIRQYVEDTLPDYQMSAFLMAVYFRGMARKEIQSLTRAMIETGDTVDLSGISGVKVDKHSTGGVGDKVSLALAPLVAAAGVTVPMMAGRGLGHTGGTLDKLESIPGFRTSLSEAEYVRQLRDVGCAIIGQSENIAPADRKMYALRDVTGTVSSIPLICGSILSKKKAEGTDALVLDVKVGSGAFLEEETETRTLARTLVDLGNDLGVQTVALLTSMDQPLGHAVGNWNEVTESADLLRDAGPADLREVTLALGGVMMTLAGKAEDVRSGIRILEGRIASGAAYDRFLEMVQAQSGDVSFIKHPDKMKPAKNRHDLLSFSDGYVTGFDTRKVGLSAMDLGAGRLRKEDKVDPMAGILFHKKVGDAVRRGEPICRLSTNRDVDLHEIEKQLRSAIRISTRDEKPQSLILGLIDEKGETVF